MRVVAASVLAGALVSSFVACSSSNDTKSASNSTQDGGTSGGAASSGSASEADPSDLFSPLHPASPDKLRGVWENKYTQGNLDAQLRLGFGNTFIAVALRCTPKSGGAPVNVTDIFGYEVDNPDTGSGSFDYGGIQLGTDAGVVCAASLPEGTVDYKVTGTNLTLSQGGSGDGTAFTKVGDL